MLPSAVPVPFPKESSSNEIDWLREIESTKIFLKLNYLKTISHMDPFRFYAKTSKLIRDLIMFVTSSKE